MKNWNTNNEKEWQSSKELNKYVSNKKTAEYFSKVVNYLNEKGINYKECRTETGCEYDYDTNTVSCINNISIMLHECGHAILKHKGAWDKEAKKVTQSDEEILSLEIEAWDKGVDIMKELSISDSNYAAYAEEMIQTYIDY